MHAFKYSFDLGLDDPKRTEIHGRIIRTKPFLKKIYDGWYGILKRETMHVPAGRMLELGSGGGFLKEVIPQVITSDIMPVAGCDMQFGADNIPFEDESLSTVFMLNVLHHLPDPAAFFSQAFAKLKHNGLIVMIEPANTLFSRFIYKRFHHEEFDTRAGWTLSGGGPLSVSNQALPWILFNRDKDKFAAMFPQAHIRKIEYHTSFVYLVSGGLSYRSLVPAWSFGFFAFLENAFAFSRRYTAMFQTIVLEKK